MVYVLICLCLSLAGVAGLQFFYMAYLERINNDHKKRVITLERTVRSLSRRLRETEESMSERFELIEAVREDAENEEEVWADVIEER